MDLENAFDRVPREVVWWALRKVYRCSDWYNARSRVRVNGSYCDEFEVKVGVHQGAVLSLLFIIVLEALPWEFRVGCP